MITVDDMVRNEVHLGVSGLISDLYTLVANADPDTRKRVSVDEDDLMAIMVQDDWEPPVGEFVSDMPRDNLIKALEEGGDDAPWEDIGDDELRARLLAHLKEEDAFRDFANDHDIEPRTFEAYEHWAISDWFGRKLKAYGEMVGDVGNLTVWGRCTTGQMISMDHVIQEIHRELTAPEAP
jgi:hypothetical protein